METPKRRFNANAVKFGGVHPYVVRTSQNNGRRATIVADDKWLNPGKTISFGQDTATIFYQPEPYFTGDKIKVLSFRHGKLNEKIACYLLTIMRKAFSNFTWGTSSFNEKVLKSVVVSLPIVGCCSRQIDFDYMDAFIRELEKVRVRELEDARIRELGKWFAASGLDNYRLTAKERKALDDWREGKVFLVGYNLGSLFDIHPTRAYKLTNATLFSHDGVNPVITNGSVNNGIGGMSKLSCTESGDMITFSDTTTADSIFYQPIDFVGYPHVQGLYSREIKWTFCQLLYITAQFRKNAIGLNFDYAHKFTRKIASSMEIQFPVVTSSHEIDFDFMETFIKATIKQTIRGVVEWKDREIAATRQAIGGSVGASGISREVPPQGR